MINVGIIGAGAFGIQHATAIAAVTGVRLVAASRTNEPALSNFCLRFGCQGYPIYQDLLNDRAIDAVVIATPHHLHTTVVLDAVGAGKHILLEKPMAPTLAECDRIVDQTKRAKIKLLLGHTGHFIPALQVAKALLESGEMGEVVYGAATKSKRWLNQERRAWHLNRTQGGGMWLTIGVHALDQLTWLIGAPVARVSARLQTRFHEQHADDTGIAFLHYANGATATAVAIGFRTGVSTFVTELTCTKGLLKIDDSKGVFVGRDERWQLIPESVDAAWMASALMNEWQAFVHAIENDSEPAVTGAFGRHIMAVAFAAEEASKGNKKWLYTIEQSLMPAQTGKRYEWATTVEAQDDLATLYQDYDWADEVLHTQIGRRWLVSQLEMSRDEVIELGSRKAVETEDILNQYADENKQVNWWPEFVLQVLGQESKMDRSKVSTGDPVYQAPLNDRRNESLKQ